MSKNTGTSELINYFDLGANGDVGIAGSLDVNTIANATTDTDKFLVSDTGIIKYRTGAELLSDIGAAPAVAGGYVPYTGATTNVDLGIYNITAHTIRATGSANNAGQINLRSDAIFSLVNGYGTIGSGTTNQFNFYQTTGAGVFRGAILSLNSITASATRTFTLPDADGTIALTSSLSGYLPLTGGTMTGVITTPNGTFGIIVGDDSRLADRNIANTLFLEGIQNTDRGYINFSQTTGNSLGAINGGDLTWRGNPVVTGTGTTNYLPKFTGASAIGNSIVQEGTNTIGINATGYTVSAGYTGLGINNATNGGVLDLLLNNVKKGEFYITSSSFNMYGFAGVEINLTVNNDLSKNFSIATTGNVLIGTTTDNGARLQVSGNTFISGFTSNNLNNHGEKFISLSGPNSVHSFNVASEFPSLGIAGNVLGVTIIFTIFGSGGTVYSAIATIARNSGGSWSSYALTAVTSTASLLQSITGSGTTVTINTSAGSYVGVKVTVITQ